MKLIQLNYYIAIVQQGGFTKAAEKLFVSQSALSKSVRLMVENVNRYELKNRIADMGAFLREQPTVLTEYDEPLVRRLIEKVTICEDKFIVEFKSGVTVDVNE